MQTELLMSIDDFRSITGLALDTEQQEAMFNRACLRASRHLVQLLGWTPNYRGMYSEIAMSKDSICPTEEMIAQWQRDHDSVKSLEDPEGTIGEIKLFPYYPEDANYFIDPCTAVHSVKIVKILSSDANEYVTVKKLMPDDWNQKTNHGILSRNLPLIRWIEVCKAPDFTACACEENQPCYMLAVDADWLRNIPDDLLYALSDLILFYMQNQPSLESMPFAVRSESVDGHSVSYDTNIKLATASEKDWLADNQTLLQLLIGPFSPLYINKTRVL